MREVCNLAQGTVVQGDVFVQHSIRIEGEIKGNVESKERVVCSPSAVIEGQIRCQSALIEGKVQGNVICAEELRLGATAKLVGDVRCSKIHIEHGAVFVGHCEMPL